MAIRLNIGAGTVPVDGFINIDMHVKEGNVIMDAKRLEYDNDSVDEIYSSHLLEHFAGSQQNMEVLEVMQEWFRVLKPGGLIRIEVPNLEWCVRNWLDQTEEQRWCFALNTIFGMQTNPGEYHKTGFSEKHLRCFFRRAGFANITITDVWSHDQQCFYAEAVKI